MIIAGQGNRIRPWVWDQRLPCAAQNQRAEFRAHVRREDGARFNAGEVAYYAERKQPRATAP